MKLSLKLMIPLAVITVFLISFIFYMHFSHYQMNFQTQADFQKSIDKRLDTILSSQITSSNPYDYLKLNKSTYESIKKQGQPAFRYLLKKLQLSKSDGLEAWIIAKLSSDILGEKNPVTHWSTGKEWLEKYKKATKKTSN